MQCLSGIVDNVVHGLVKDDNGDRLTRHLLRLEREIRVLLAAGARGSLSALWDDAASRLMAQRRCLAERQPDARAPGAEGGRGTRRLRRSPCPPRLLKRAWSVVQERKTRKLSEDLRRLIISLSNILEADAARSAAGRSADALKSSIGTGHAEVFDFAALSRVLSSTAAREGLPAGRRRRIEALLSVLKSQRFLPVPGDGERHALHERCYAFAFDSCADALAAYRERLPKAMELAKSIAVAELEVEGEYREDKHDALFKDFGEGNLGRGRAVAFPRLPGLRLRRQAAGRGNRPADGNAVRRPAGQDPGADRRPAGRIDDRPRRALRPRHARQAARQHGDRPERCLRAAIERARTCSSSATGS